MTINKLCYRYLESPNNDFDVKEVYPEPNTMVFKRVLEPSVNGCYKIEYWAVDDTGKESDRKISEINVRDYIEPKPVPGGVFLTPVNSQEMKNLVFSKCNVVLKFNKLADGLGYSFDWSLLDLSDLVVEQNKLEIPTSSWLYKYMLSHNSSFVVEFFLGRGKKMVATYKGCDYELVNESGEIQNLPINIQKIVDMVQWINGRLKLRVLKPISLIWQ